MAAFLWLFGVNVTLYLIYLKKMKMLGIGQSPRNFKLEILVGENFFFNWRQH